MTYQLHACTISDLSDNVCSISLEEVLVLLHNTLVLPIKWHGKLVQCVDEYAIVK